MLFCRPNDPAARLLLVALGSMALVGAIDALGWTSLGGWNRWWYRQPVSIFAYAAALHLFLVFPARNPLLARLSAIGPPALRRVGGATVPLLYVLPLTLVFASVVGLAPMPLVADTIGHVLLIGVVLALGWSYLRSPTAGPRAAPLDPGRSRSRPPMNWSWRCSRRRTTATTWTCLSPLASSRPRWCR